MSDSPLTPTPSQAAAHQFARCVAALAAAPGQAAEQRTAVRALAKVLKQASATLAPSTDGALLVDGEQGVSDDAELAAACVLLAGRLDAYGVEELTLGRGAAEADLFDLVRLLAAMPDGDDPQGSFAARAAVIDPRGIPRRMRARPTVETPSASPVVEGSSVDPIRDRRSAETLGEAGPAKEPDTIESLRRAEPLLEPPPLPDVAEIVLAGIVRRLEMTTEVSGLSAALAPLVAHADLAFRTGRFETVVDALAALIAIEYRQLEADASDDRRREFGQALRQLATPAILRELAAFRYLRADDETRAKQIQAILHRYGTDGAEALIDAYSSAPTERARAVCLEALRALRRTHDALFDIVRGAGGLALRQAAELLGQLGDERAEELLVELLRHPDLRTRRAAVAALERFTTDSSLEALGFALIDEEPLVRLRVVAALAVRRGDAAARLLLPLLDAEPDRDVLHGAVAALGAIAASDAVQGLIRVAQGESNHPHRRSASYRLQACRALVNVRTPAAMAAVQRLKDDRDRELRSGATRLVAQAARRSTGSVRAVSAP